MTLKSRPQPPRLREYRKGLFVVIVILIASASVSGQTLASTVKVSVSATDLARIDLHFARPVKSWSFLNAYGGTIDLGSRILDPEARGIDGQTIQVRNVAPGEFRSGEAAVNLSYRVRLTIPRADDVAHVSWLTPQYGLLMLADLLPRELSTGEIFAEFSLPNTWGIQTSAGRNEKRQFVVPDPVKAVFLVGESLRNVNRVIEGMNLVFAFSGNWPFQDDKAANAASRLLKKYFELTGFKLSGKSIVIIAPIPLTGSALSWTAETRGSTVLLLLDSHASFRNWIAQLEVIFTHELFHLWVPNSLRLAGDYDWFFEGFTLYQALLTARESKLISFQGYLDTLGRVYDSYRSNADHLSLIEASERRWTGSNSAVYDKGMLVAFLYDLMLREESNGKAGLSEKYRGLFREYSTKAANGNEAIMSILISSSATGEFLRSHVESKKSLDLEALLNRYGLLVDSGGSQTHLRVADNPGKDQIRLLRTLGYKRP